MKDTLAYMSKLLRDEIPDYFVKVIVVGEKVGTVDYRWCGSHTNFGVLAIYIQRSGKTCLVQALCNPHGTAQILQYRASPSGVAFHELTLYPNGTVRPTANVIQQFL